MAKLTKPVIAVNIDGTVRVLNQDPNATHFNWYTRELLSYNITSPSYDTVVAGTNESKTALPNSSYTNRVYITENYRDIRKFTSFKLYEAGSSAVDVTELYVTKISDFEYSISIPNVEHDYIITWGVGAITYTITSSLTNCVADKSDESYVGGTAVNIVITAATGYTFDSSLGGTIGLSVGEVDKTSEYMTRSSDNKKVTIAIPAIAAVGNIIYAAGAVKEIVQLATPTIAMNADGKTLEITDVENATSYDVYVDGTMKTNVASAPNTTTVDLSTLSDIADGAHTVKVKAKASGYNDSEFSNEVSYTKAPTGYAITFGTITSKHTYEYNGSDYNIKFDDGSYLRLESSSDVSVEYYDANDNRIGNIAVGGDNMATKFGVAGVNSSTVEYYGRLTQYPDSVDFGYFTVGNSEHFSPTVSSSNPHTTKTVSGELNIYGKHPD